MRIYLLEPGQIEPQAWNGVSRYSTQLVRALAQVDSSLDFVTLHFSLRRRVPDDRLASLGRVGVRLLAAPWPDLSAVAPYNRFIQRRVVPRWAERLGCDIVWGTNYTTLPRGKRRFRTAVTIHDLFPLAHPEQSQPEFTQDVLPELRRSARDADLVLTVSQYSAGEIERLLDVPREKIAVTYEGVSPELACEPDRSPEEVLAELGLEERPLLSVGTVEPRKNYERGLRVYELLRRRLGSAPPWVIAGRDGWRYERFYAERARLGLDGTVRVLGSVPDEPLAALYRWARCLFYPSLEEGFGLPLVEAMTAGLPVVCSTGGALPEVGGDATLPVDPADVDGMAAGLERVLTDSQLAADLSERGRNRAVQFSWQAAAQKTLAAFQQVVG